jgi:hypothetical protein
MIVVRLMGGLGNQMFEYAAGLRLAARHRTELKLDLTFLLDRTPRPNFVFRDLDLDVFPIAIEAASDSEVRRFRSLAGDGRPSLLRRAMNKFARETVYIERAPEFDAVVLDLPDNTYLEGYFQDERYFADVRDEVRRRFTLPPAGAAIGVATRALADRIRADDAICLNVRRGDYVTNPEAAKFHGVCSKSYYDRGVSELRRRGVTGKVYVFSDDVDWCRDAFPEADGFTVVGHEHDGERFELKLWLMSLCSHFVIPNSSYGWWAAWLSTTAGKLVVRPSRWFRDPGRAAVNVCPRDWIAVSNDDPT